MATPTHIELMKMKDMTRMTGYLNNVQIKQLQMWPSVILGAQDADVEFDPENHQVTVDLKGIDYGAVFTDYEKVVLFKEKLVDLYRQRLSYFDKCVKYLLGNEYATVVKFKGHTLGSAPPSAPAEEAHPPDFKRAEEWLKKQKK